MSTNQAAISVEGLRKSYKAVTAVDGLSFEVEAGEIFGMVGPNGSGKTTTIECIEGLRQPEEGRIKVLGLDPIKDIYELRERTGIQLQAANLPRRMRVGEALDLFASFYREPLDWPEDVLQLANYLGIDKFYVFGWSAGGPHALACAYSLPERVLAGGVAAGLAPMNQINDTNLNNWRMTDEN